MVIDLHINFHCNCNISLKLGHVFTVFAFSDMTLLVFQLFTQDIKENF